jgi:drug/metabolite transporter (DMT)-like permease
VAVLSNVDVPMLVILGSWVGQRSTIKAKFLSITSIVVLVFYSLHLHQQSQWLFGISALGLGTFLLCFGYFFIKKSMQEENAAITVLTPSLAIIAYGFGQYSTIETLSSNWNSETLLVCALSGVGMFGAYFATMKLYEITDIATAEFPTLVSSIAIQPIEAFLFNEKLVPSNFWLSMLFVGITYLILNIDKAKPEVCHAR